MDGQICDERGPLSLAEILQERFGQDFSALLQSWGREHPEEVGHAVDRAGIKDAPELLEATLLRTESCFLQDPANTAADLLLRGLWSFRRSRRTEQAAGLFRLR